MTYWVTLSKADETAIYRLCRHQFRNRHGREPEIEEIDFDRAVAGPFATADAAFAAARKEKPALVVAALHSAYTLGLDPYQQVSGAGCSRALEVIQRRDG